MIAERPSSAAGRSGGKENGGTDKSVPPALLLVTPLKAPLQMGTFAGLGADATTR